MARAAILYLPENLVVVEHRVMLERNQTMTVEAAYNLS